MSGKIYVELHPDYKNSQLTVETEYIPQLREYVRLVDWINYDWDSRSGKYSYILINSASRELFKEQHTYRTYIALQRFRSVSQEVRILIRNIRGEKWNDYIPVKQFTEEEMLNEECAAGYDAELRMKWAQEAVERDKTLITFFDDKKTKEQYIKRFKDDEKKLRDMIIAENEKRQKLSVLWEQKV